MKLLLRLPEDARKKDVNMKLQRWENEGGNRQNVPEGVGSTPGLLTTGQKLEVLDTRIVKYEGALFQEVTIKPLTTKESSR